MKTQVPMVGVALLLAVAGAGCASKTGGQAAAGSGTSASSSPSSSGSAMSPSGGGSAGPVKGGSPTSVNPGGTNIPAPGGGKPPGTDGKPGTDQVKPVQGGVSVSADGRTLTAEVSWGGCQVQPRLVVESQTSTQVRVAIVVHNNARTGVMCPDIARDGTASVTLAAPLGSRHIVDAVTGAMLR